MSNGFEILSYSLKQPKMLILIAPLVIVLFLLLKFNFVKEISQTIIKSQKKYRFGIMISRSLIIILLVLALANPIIERKTFTSGEFSIKLLVDESASMSLYDQDKINNFIQELESSTTVETYRVSSGENTNIGDEILNIINPFENVLLISDGNNNFGSSINDVLVYTNSINSTINLLDLQEYYQDYSVEIFGQSRTIADVKNEFTIFINKFGSLNPVHLKVIVDDLEVFDEMTNQESISFEKAFSEGKHNIEAEILLDDYFNQNNHYYKTVKVIEKPKILFLPNINYPILQVLEQLYNVEKRDLIPNDLDDYYAIILDDLLESEVNDKVSGLMDYVSEGDGLVVLGGKSSYDYGSYKDSLFEKLLPVMVGSAERKEGDTNIIILMDISSSTGSMVDGVKVVDIEKALTISTLQDLKSDTNVGVIAFNTQAYLVSELSPLYKKVDLVEKIESVVDGGGTYIYAGMKEAMDYLDRTVGSKVMIIISDGITQLPNVVYEGARMAVDKGIRIFTVGVGEYSDEDILANIASIGNGAYIRQDDRQTLKILFGEEESNITTNNLVTINKDHFITKDFEPQAMISGFNIAVPKSSANLLVSTAGADPILTVWRFGLGRVASLTTDDGKFWAGQLLNEINTRLITRMINWAIGNPEKKKEYYINIPDAIIQEPSDIVVKSEMVPEFEDVTFFKERGDLYRAYYNPSNIGFITMLNEPVAVNYKREYLDLGVREGFKEVLKSGGGEIFEKDINKIISTLESKARREILREESLAWFFLFLALGILIIEILIRRIIEIRKTGVVI